MPPRDMRNMPRSFVDSAEFGFAITPHDSTNFTYPVRAITIGGAPGVIVYINWNNDVCTTGVLPQGTYAIKALRVNATNTTATDLTGWV